MADAMRLVVGALYKRKFASVTKISRPSRTLTSIVPAGCVRRPRNVLQYLPRHAWPLGNVHRAIEETPTSETALIALSCIAQKCRIAFKSNE